MSAKSTSAHKSYQYDYCPRRDLLSLKLCRHGVSLIPRPAFVFLLGMVLMPAARPPCQGQLFAAGNVAGCQPHCVRFGGAIWEVAALAARRICCSRTRAATRGRCICRMVDAFVSDATGNGDIYVLDWPSRCLSQVTFSLTRCRSSTRGSATVDGRIQVRIATTSVHVRCIACVCGGHAGSAGGLSQRVGARSPDGKTLALIVAAWAIFNGGGMVAVTLTKARCGC